MQRNPETLQILALRSLIDDCFKKIRAAVLVPEPNYAVIEALIQPLLKRDVVSQQFESHFVRAFRLQFWPVMIEMFKDHATAIQVEFSELSKNKNLEHSQYLLKLKEILLKYLGYEFSPESCDIFFTLFNQRCDSLSELKKIAEHRPALNFTTKDVETDFEKVVYTVPEFLEKYSLPFLRNLIEAKLQIAAAGIPAEDPCKPHFPKLSDIFEASCYYGSETLLTAMFELLDNNACLNFIKHGFRSGYSLVIALERKHPGILTILIEKWHRLAQELPEKQLDFFQSLRIAMHSVMNSGDYQCIFAVLNCCLAVSVPVEGTAHPERLTERLFPLDVTQLFIQKSQMPFLDMLAHYYINTGGFGYKEPTLSLVAFLKQQLTSLEEVDSCHELSQVARR